MSATAQQTPAQEMVDRALEYAPARGVPFLIGLQNMQHMFGLKHKKDREDYAYEKKLRGDMTEGEVPSVGPEEMGDITVAGDTNTTIHNHYHGTPNESKGELAGIAKKLLPLALATGLGAGGAWLATQWAAKPNPAATDTDTNTKYAIEALPGE